MEEISKFKDWKEEDVNKFMEDNGMGERGEEDTEFTKHLREFIKKSKCKMKVEDKEFDNKMFESLLTIEIPLGDFE